MLAWKLSSSTQPAPPQVLIINHYHYRYHSCRAGCLGLRSTKFLGKDMTAEEKELTATRSRFINRGGAVRHAKLIPSRQLMALRKLPRQLFWN